MPKQVRSGWLANDQQTSLLLTNSGIGPALIDDVRIQYQGHETTTDPYDFFAGRRPGVVQALSVDKLMPGQAHPGRIDHRAARILRRA